jgi:hypothetical protein
MPLAPRKVDELQLVSPTLPAPRFGGKWLHGAIEGYRVNKDLVGRGTAAGPIPKTLCPIFRDRKDFFRRVLPY